MNTITNDEFEYWCSEYPELSPEDVLLVLEAVDGKEINNKKELLEHVALGKVEQGD